MYSHEVLIITAGTDCAIFGPFSESHIKITGTTPTALGDLSSWITTGMFKTTEVIFDDSMTW